MTYSNNQTLALPTVRLVLGILAIILSLVFSIQFVAQGNTGAAIISAVIFCLITEFCKTVFAGDFAFYFETGQGSKALFSGVIVALLFALSISAAVFVLTISPAKQETLINQSDSKQQQLEQAIAAKQTQLSTCNQNYLTRCVNPRNNELNALQSELSAVMASSKDTLDAKANMQFWKKAADYLGTNPNSLQLNFAIARAVLLDLLGIILVSQYTATKRLNSDLTRYQQQPQQPPQVQQQQTPPPQVQQPPQQRQSQPLPNPINYKVSNFSKW